MRYVCAYYADSADAEWQLEQDLLDFAATTGLMGRVLYAIQGGYDV